MPEAVVRGAEAVADQPLTEAEQLAIRTGKAVAYVMERHAATDLASFIDLLPMPNDPQRKAMMLEEATEVMLRALSYMAAMTYGLCLLLRKDVSEAGQYFRRGDVQQEMRDRAMRAAIEVMR